VLLTSPIQWYSKAYQVLSDGVSIVAHHCASKPVLIDN
jgi:hypothetical protein